MKLKVIIIALLVLIFTAISGCLSDSGQTLGQTAPPPDLSEQKENSEAGVTITAVYLGDSAFEIKMDTHSGSLDYDMAKISYIRDGYGNIIKPQKWDGGIGGHHFSGTLTFPEFDDSRSFELVIQDVSEVKERVLKWS